MNSRLFAAMIFVGATTATAANATTITEGSEGWGGPAFDFTNTRTANGTDYFGWDPLKIDAEWNNGTFNFDINMPRQLTGGDNFDLVIDWNDDGVDSDGDFLVHYANNGSSAGGGWDAVWDAKTYTSGSWQHAGSGGLGDLTQPNVTASTSDKENFQISFDGNSDISYQWLSPLGDEGFPESWTGEAVVIGFWDGGSASDNVSVAASSTSVPLPATAVLFGAGLLGLAAFRRRQS